VTPHEAAELLKLLRAAYPEAKRRLGADTTDLWLVELRQLDAALGEQAVRSLIASVRRPWPLIAELNEQVEIVRRQAATARRDRERQQADEIAEELPRPSLAGIPAVQALLDNWSESFGLPEAPPGDCDDCGREATKPFRLGSFVLCRDCVRKRKAASLVVQGGRPDPAPESRHRDQPADRPRRRRDPARADRPPAPGRTTCRLCGEKLRAHEAPEGVCDTCLRARGAVHERIPDTSRSDRLAPRRGASG